MEARMSNPAMLIPEAMQALLALARSTREAGVPARTLGLVHLRASQINGCGLCIDMGTREARQSGESDERLRAVAAWRESSHFDRAERAALALAEAVTRLSEQADPVPNDIWDEAARHYEEQALAALIIAIATTNL